METDEFKQDMVNIADRKMKEILDKSGRDPVSAMNSPQYLNWSRVHDKYSTKPNKNKDLHFVPAK